MSDVNLSPEGYRREAKLRVGWLAKIGGCRRQATRTPATRNGSRSPSSSSGGGGLRKWCAAREVGSSSVAPAITLRSSVRHHHGYDRQRAATGGRQLDGADSAPGGAEPALREETVGSGQKRSPRSAPAAAHARAVAVMPSGPAWGSQG